MTMPSPRGSPPRRLASKVRRACRAHPWGRSLSQGARLRRPWRYVAGELSRRPATRAYVLRCGGLKVVLRHGSTDITTFDEIFCSSAYEPPAVVAAAIGEPGGTRHILDLGANVGLFTVFALRRWPGARITAFEPDPANVAVLRSCVALNPGDVTVVGAAAASADGFLPFVTGRGAESHRRHPDEIAPTVDLPCVDVFAHLATADFAKIDIEGGEWELLADARLVTVGLRALVVEHHGRHCPTDDPRATARRMLVDAGFQVQPGGSAVGGVGVLWAWRAAPAAESG